jgi:hypothetical protein
MKRKSALQSTSHTLPWLWLTTHSAAAAMGNVPPASMLRQP